MTNTNTASGAEEIATRLRNACASVRNKSYPLADLIPLMQQAADALASAAAPAEQPAPSAAAAEIENLRKALQFYANGEHFMKADEHAWDTVSGEPQNYWCDEAGTATVEDGSIAGLALAGRPVQFEDDAPQPDTAYAALERLEQANETLCKLRTSEQYRSMIDSGQKDALLELDDARVFARTALRAARKQGGA